MRHHPAVLGAALLFALAVTASTNGQDSSMKPMTMMKIDQATVNRITSTWKAEPKALSQKIIEKYGMPQEASANRLIWMNNGPWKWSELVNEEIQHDFPMPHHDMFYQAIAWKVPTDKFDDLAEYDGSVTVDRTKGEVGARCDKEEANFLAINLAHDIVTKGTSVNDARKMYAEAVGEMKHPEYMKGFRFTPPTGNQGCTVSRCRRISRPRVLGRSELIVVSRGPPAQRRTFTVCARTARAWDATVVRAHRLL